MVKISISQSVFNHMYRFVFSFSDFFIKFYQGLVMLLFLICPLMHFGEVTPKCIAATPHRKKEKYNVIVTVQTLSL